MSDVSLGETSRRLDALEARVSSRFSAIERRIDESVVPREVYKSELAAINAHLNRIDARYDSDASWRRTLVVAVTSSVIMSFGSIIASVVH